MKKLIYSPSLISYQSTPSGAMNKPLTALIKLLRLACLILATSLLGSACSVANDTSASPAIAPTLNEKIQQVYEQVNDMTSDTYCDTVQDCAFVSMGERACGGPSSYHVYSKRIGDEAIGKLQKLAAESTTLAKKQNSKSGLLSTCEIYPLPSLSCLNNQCVKNQSQHLTH